MKPYRSWLLLFFVTLLLRLGMAGYWEYRNGSEHFYFGDSDTYWVLGKTIAAGQPYRYYDQEIHRMPGYPVLLSPLFLLFGEQMPILVARLENVLIGSMTVFAAAWLAWILFQDKLLALLAGWLIAIDPLNIVMSVLVLTEAPFCFLMTLQIIFWCKAIQTATKPPYKTAWFSLLLSGLFTAAAIYCRPSWLYFVPFAMVIGVTLSPKHFVPILKSGAVIIFICVLSLTPWWIRNYQITGHFVSTTLQTGSSLYDGLNPEATGASDMAFVEVFRNDELNNSLNHSENHSKNHTENLEYRLNQKMRQAAVNWAWNHPALAWKLVQSKFFRLWNFIPNEASLSTFAAKMAVSCTYFPVLILGIIGVIRSLRRDFSFWLLWIPACYLTALHIVFVSSIRYRAPAMICLSILAAWTLLSLSRGLFGGTKKN